MTIVTEGLRGSQAAACRGSWLLGSACGHCDRCAAEAPLAITHLLARLRSFEELTKLVVTCIPAKPRLPGREVDFTDEAKVKFFEAARAQLYNEEGALRG